MGGLPLAGNAQMYKGQFAAALGLPAGVPSSRSNPPQRERDGSTEGKGLLKAGRFTWGR